jgi:GT2 family glycosyltransferase
LTTISALIVNYNGLTFIGDLLTSLQRQTLTPDEIVVVDNASTDGSVDFLRATFPNVKLVLPGENTGYAQGNNLALAHARGEYLAILNPDTIVAADWLAELVQVLESDPRIAVTTGRILNTGRVPPVESAGGGFNNLGYNYAHHLQDSNRTAFERPTDVAVMAGCGMLLRRSALAGEPIFDPALFMYCDELDLSLRLLGRGHRIVAVPTARQEHRGSLSVRSVTRRPKLFQHFYFQRNRLKILAKYYPVHILVESLPLILGSLLYWDLLFLWHGGPRLLVRALAGQVVYGRRGVAERRRHGINPQAWLPWMTRHGVRDMLRLRAASPRWR